MISTFFEVLCYVFRCRGRDDFVPGLSQPSITFSVSAHVHNHLSYLIHLSYLSRRLPDPLGPSDRRRYARYFSALSGFMRAPSTYFATRVDRRRFERSSLICCAEQRTQRPPWSGPRLMNMVFPRLEARRGLKHDFGEVENLQILGEGTRGFRLQPRIAGPELACIGLRKGKAAPLRDGGRTAARINGPNRSQS